LVGGSLETVLLDLALIGEDALLDAVKAVHHVHTVSTFELRNIDPDVARLVPPRMAARYELVPFRLEGKRLSVATLHPGDMMVEDELNMLTGCFVTTFAALEVRLYEALERLYQVQRSPLQVSVSKKLDAPQRRIAPARAPSPPKPEEAPSTQVSEPERPERPVPMPRRPVSRAPVAHELEISDDDLAAFPSLRGLRLPEPEPEPEPEPVAEVEAAPAPAPAAAKAELTLEQRLVAASTALQNAEIRDEIADALLEFSAPYLRRRMMLAVRKETVIGWRGEGEGVEEMSVRAISIPLGEPSIFVGLAQGMAFWLGPLPPMARNIDLLLGLGGEEPRDCVVLPIQLRDKVFCFLYGDNGHHGVAGVPMAYLRRLVAKASVAFQVYLLKHKIRTL
jgi:hypothetical protein